MTYRVTSGREADCHTCIGKRIIITNAERCHPMSPCLNMAQHHNQFLKGPKLPNGARQARGWGLYALLAAFTPPPPPPPPHTHCAPHLQKNGFAVTCCQGRYALPAQPCLRPHGPANMSCTPYQVGLPVHRFEATSNGHPKPLCEL